MKLNLLPNAGTEIHQPVTENQVIKMITSFFRNASRSLNIRLPRGQPDSTRNGFSGSKWPAEKAGQAGGQVFANL